MLSVTSTLEPGGTMLPAQCEFGIVCDVRQRNLDAPCRLSECVSFFGPSLSRELALSDTRALLHDEIYLNLTLEHSRLSALFELASFARGMQNSPGREDRVPRTLCLSDMVPNGTSRPSHMLPPSAPPPGLPRRADGLNWAPPCSPEEWAAWCRVRDGLDVSNDFFEVVQIEQEEESSERSEILTLRATSGKSHHELRHVA